MRVLKVFFGTCVMRRKTGASFGVRDMDKKNQHKAGAGRRTSVFQQTSEIVRRYGFNFRKRFGQNFLTDENVLEEIVEASKITKDDLVIEIGPGIGTLTRYLCEAAGQVVSVEIDRDLVRILQETLSEEYDNVRIVEGDVLKVDLNALAAEYSCRGLKIVANLPYYITTPILMSLFEKGVPADRVTVMVQKEVADRMTAGCGSRDYGSLSLAVQYYSEPRIVTYVPASSFMPSPKVDSAVVTLRLYEDKPVKVRDQALLKAVIRATFSQRRKTLANSLGNAPQVPASREEVAAALTGMGLSESVRGEKLTLAEFAQLTDLLAEGPDGPSGKRG